MHHIHRRIIFSLFFILLFFPLSTVHAGKEVTRYEFPDVRDDFCGAFINYQYCKCAFHNDYCDEVGLSRGAANAYVWSEYREWVRAQINTAGAECVRAGGFWTVSNRSCTICTPPHVNIGNACEKQDEALAEIEGPMNRNCTPDETFDVEWEKYSDIDSRIEESSRSYEAQQYAQTITEIVGKKAELYNLQVEMETDRLARLELRNIREALVQNIKVNLLKSFWRLSYITYTTIKSGASTGKTYVDMLNPDTVVEGVAKGISVIQANVPSDSSLAIDTSTAKGKVTSIGANAALEAMDSLGNPVKVATKVFDESIKSTFPSADITPEEVELLRNQYLRNRSLDMKIQESYLINSQRRMNAMELEKEIAVLTAQAQEWKEKEKTRVQDMLADDCKRQQQRE